MNVSTKATQTGMNLVLTGSFTYADNHSFRLVIQDVQRSRPQSLTIDFGAVDFIDSAAMGMLLLLRDIAEKAGTTLVLAHAKGQVQKMFALSRFDQLFTIRTS